MNATVKRIVEILFQDTEMTEEVQAMRDELMDNCQQRYEDLMAQGKSEDEAIALVVESLKGMEEVIGAYPRAKAASRPAQAEETAEGHRIWRFPAEQVQQVQVNLLYQDVTVLPGQGDSVTVRVEGRNASCLNARMLGDTLCVERQEESGGRSMRWLNWMFFSSWGEKVQVELPASCHPRLSVRCTSGDLYVRDVYPREARVDAMSGDITLQLDPDCVLEEAVLKSASGDIRVSCSAARMEMQSMSGDVSYDGECPDVAAHSISGDVRLRGGFERVRVKSVSGDVRLEEQGKSLRQVDAQTTSGDVSIRLPKDTPGVHLTGKSGVGDVRNRFRDTGAAGSVLIDAQTASGDVTIH